MPKINWEEFSEIQHYVGNVRTIICSTWLRLDKLKLKCKWKEDAITRLKKLDKHLEAFEAYLIMIIIKYQAEKM